jgi:hypothetical protein
MSEQPVVYDKQEIINCHAKYLKTLYEVMLPNLQNLMDNVWRSIKRATEDGVHHFSVGLGARDDKDGTKGAPNQAYVSYAYLYEKLTDAGNFTCIRRFSHIFQDHHDGRKICACGEHDPLCFVNMDVSWDPLTL